MRANKIRWQRLLILVAGAWVVLLLCCIAVATIGPNLRRIIQAPFWNTNSQFAAQAGHRMLDYELPPNYQELKALNIQGQDAVVIIAQRGQPDNLIFIMSAVSGASTDAELRATVEERWSREVGEHSYDTRTVSRQTTIIRGQSTPVRVLEGTDEKRRQIRQAACVIAGKGGDILVSVVSSQEAWDQAVVDRFLQSIR